MGKALNKKLIIIGGQIDEISTQIISIIKENDCYIVCADRGYQFASKNKITPDLIVGDFDSAPYPDDICCEVIKLPTHKDDTDLLFAVRLGLTRGFKDFILTGVTGGRLDQTFATVFTLNFLIKNGACAKVLDKNSKLFVTDSELVIKRPEYPCYFSIFPLDGVASGVNIEGSVYLLNNAKLTNDFPIGVSNEFSDDCVTVSVKQGKLLVMVVKK